MNDNSDHPHEEPSSENGESSEQSQSHGHREYFLPGKIILHVEHSLGIADLDLVKLAESIDRNVNEKLENKKLEFESERKLIKKVQPRNILTFPRHQGSPFSMVPVELDSEANLVKILVDLDEKLKATGSVDLGQGAKWQAVSPNWLLGSAGHGKPHPPSPGSWPSAIKAPKKADWKFSLVEKDTGETREWPPEFANDGANVHVAILDTAHCATDLDEAHLIWREENELIDQLLKPKPRKLRLVTDIYAEIELLDCSLSRHRYWMADHGLFIAGEIASIAPQSKIHLIKAFTSYGSASSLTIAQGLFRLLNDDEIGRPLVVNCSFGLAAKKDDPEFNVQFPNPESFERMQTSLKELFDELTSQDDVIVVAAAGDDSGPETGRVPARLPAAYERVIGVGAMPRISKTQNNPFPMASYSNRADIPPKTGYVTLGGEPRSSHSVPAEGTQGIQGILGLYISEFPDYTGSEDKPPKDPKEATRDHLIYKSNKDKGEGNAEWAGASFAAPIITGILARWCSQKFNGVGSIKVEDARNALDSLSQGATTAAGEQVILVTQG